MKVFYVIMKDKERSIFGYIVAESMDKVLEIAPYKVTECSERGDLLAMQGQIEVSSVIEFPKAQEATPKRRGIARWKGISG